MCEDGLHMRDIASIGSLLIICSVGAMLQEVDARDTNSKR